MRSGLMSNECILAFFAASENTVDQKIPIIKVMVCDENIGDRECDKYKRHLQRAKTLESFVRSVNRLQAYFPFHLGLSLQYISEW